jgi:hypothetical protein
MRTQIEKSFISWPLCTCSLSKHPGRTGTVGKYLSQLEQGYKAVKSH